MKSQSNNLRGFTLIEAVIVIAITGVIAAIVAVFIVNPVKGYASSVIHAQLTDAAEATLLRMQREIRVALPNSLRVTDSTGSGANTCSQSAALCYVEFIPTTTGGLYRADGDGSTGGNVLSFSDSAIVKFDVVGSSSSVGAANSYVVINNTGQNPTNAYQDSSGNCTNCNIAKIASTSGNTVTLASNPFATESPPSPSANNRFQVVPSTGPVSYTCSPSSGAAVNRYTGYAFAQTQPTSFAVSAAPVLSNAICKVTYSPAVLSRNGILFISITVTDASSGDNVTVFREIHVDNSP